MVKILITGAGSLLGQGIIRSLRPNAPRPNKEPDSFELIGVDPSPLSAGLFWCDRAHLVPMAADAAYLEAVERIFEAERPDAVLLGADEELPIFSAHREWLEMTYHTHIIVSSPEVIEIADDKWQTACFLRENGLAFPDSCLPGDEEALIERVGFPLVVKPRRGGRSFGMSVVQDRASLKRAIDEGTDLVIQECVGEDDGEYTASALCFDGRVDASIVMRRDLKDGNTYRAYVEPFPELNAYIREVAAKLNHHGPANFQFRIDKGAPKIFEINARYSGTTPLRARVGFNEVDMVLRHLLEGQPIRQPEIEPAVILRHWGETIVSQEQIARVGTP